jgi:predicted NAD/FAD-dependent oxidoreductase
MLLSIMAIHDVIVLGAGVAGLQCARRLSSAGWDVLVVDRADRPGGRCATRTFSGQPADYGPPFVHGDDPRFLSAVDAVPGERLSGWPVRVSGRGSPCQPDAFAPFETRLAFVEGVNAFPRVLAEGLAIRLRAQAASVGIERDGIVVTLEGGERLKSRDLVLAMALEQTGPFLRQLGQADGTGSAAGASSAAGALGMLEMFASIPCLAVIAGYEPSAPMPDWDICYPEDEPALLLLSNESSKRRGTGSPVLLIQASGSWSAKRLERPKEEWGHELLTIAAGRLGPWAGSPAWTHPHRWRYSRLDRANELAGPLELRIGVSRIGIAGDLFSPGGGLQAAWLSGDRLGSRLTQ